MYLLTSSVVIFALFANVQSQAPKPTPLPIMAKVRVSSGEARLFSGEDVQLSCSVPDQPAEKWRYHWFRNDETLSTVDVLNLKTISVLQGGDYTCQGEKAIDSWPYSLKTLKSEPLKLHVDAGWALLRVPAEPVLIEEEMTLTCRIREPRILVEVIFYKEGVVIKKQKHRDLLFPNLTLEDRGSYWCRATWLQQYEYHSAQSVPAYVTVLDKLNTPELEIESEDFFIRQGEKVVLKCVTQLNAREKGLSIDYYFFYDGTRLGPASSSETYTITSAGKEDSGIYACKVRVKALNLERYSEPVELKVN